MKKYMLFYLPGEVKYLSRSLVNISILYLCLLTFFLPGCSDVNKSHDPGVQEKESVTLTIVSGNNQAGEGGKELADPLVVKVSDSGGTVLENVNLIFRVVEGEGTIIDEPNRQTGVDGRAAVRWLIGSGYNGVETIVSDASYKAAPRYFFAQGENPAGIFKTRTINSLKKVSDTLYEITFYGDYGEILKNQNWRYGGSYDYTAGSPQNFEGNIGYITGSTTAATEEKHYCSLFSAFGSPDNFLFGRSFDNPSGWRCLTLAGRYNPPDGHMSLALMRMRDIGFHPGVDFAVLSFSEKERLLEAPFHPPDGINEHGVVVGLANVRALTFTPDPGKKSIYITLLVREILDHAKNIDEAAEIARYYNVFCGSPVNLDVHALVADASGRSAILELYEDEIRVIPNTEPWQVLTNSPTYNIPIPERRQECWRYDRIYDFLETASASITWQTGMDLLNSVGNTYTEWSAIYDITHKKMILAIDFNFNDLFHIAFE